MLFVPIVYLSVCFLSVDVRLLVRLSTGGGGCLEIFVPFNVFDLRSHFGLGRASDLDNSTDVLLFLFLFGQPAFDDWPTTLLPATTSVGG